MSSSTQQVPSGIKRAKANTNTKANINGNDERVDVDIAIIDTGIDLNHPDLNVYRNVNMINSNLSGADDNGHGTHVAGTAAALDNGFGVVGMAPGARLWSVKVLDAGGSGFMSDIIEGIDYVAQHASEIEVANMSLGCQCTSQALDTAINNAVGAGVVFTVAAGNSGINAQTFSPAKNPNVIAVSAVADYDGLPGALAQATCRTDPDDKLAGFSNYGSVVDIAAPGVCILSTMRNNSYGLLSGTSMASPHVAGAVALYLAGRPKPANATDVANVRSAIIAAGFPQSGPNGFTGDRDTSPEPLLNAAGL